MTNAFGDGFTLQVPGTGFPCGHLSLGFHDIDLGFAWPPGITDSGLGDTFAAQLGGTFDLAQAVLGDLAIRFRAGDFLAAAHLAPVPTTAVPAIPTILALALAAAAVLFVGQPGQRRRRGHRG